MNATSDYATAKPHTGVSPLGNPWVQLIIGIICMACVANLQYGWTLFVNPIDAKYHWGVKDIQWAFTIFVFIETWLVPVEGYLVDRFGPKWVVIGGGILVGIAWMMNSAASSLVALYAGAVVGGIGTGAVYGTCVGNALKWFPGRRGLAAGLTAAGFGAGAAATVIPISHMITADGYQHAFLFFGVLQGGIVFVLGWLLLVPPPQILSAQVKPSSSNWPMNEWMNLEKIENVVASLDSAIRNQAVTSSIAAHAIVSAPTGRLIIRRSARIRASTGNAVIDIETPMNRANATNFLSGPTSLYSGSATAMPRSIGIVTLAFEIAVACRTLPFSWPRSTSSPTRNM